MGVEVKVVGFGVGVFGVEEKELEEVSVCVHT